MFSSCALLGVKRAPLVAFLVLASAGVRNNRAHSSHFSGTSASATTLPGTSSTQSKNLQPISIDYPEDGSIFPPDFSSPTFLWRDAAAAQWTIEFVFSDGAPPLQIRIDAKRMKIGPVDPECATTEDQAPVLTRRQSATWTWTPDPVAWSKIQKRSSASVASFTITGYRNGEPVSSGRETLITSADLVGAPIFYRDVPLMPFQGPNGVVQPLDPSVIHLIKWRMRDIRKPDCRIVLQDMPTCGNCHSFSMDGKTLGMDIDGPSNDKGLYALAPVQRIISIGEGNLVHWNTDGRVGKVRVGFMSQVSPDGNYVLSTFAGPSVSTLLDSYYVTNFTDYRFLQVFYPTRGILEWYDRRTGKRQPLPGADDPRYVQTDGVWSPDGKFVVFARAEAKDPYAPGQKRASRANDPNETPIQYELFRVPFNNGAGGVPERIVGASQNGMSNNFPKVSPDGRWIVFVECHNGQLMRPDSQLFIVPFSGGTARRLRANTSLMNSWHSFSPNGRWLVFSSKARSPFTQMYLTHIDEDGNDSPPVLIENSTAANRAVNIPEFVNVPEDAIERIVVHVVDGSK